MQERNLRRCVQCVVLMNRPRTTTMSPNIDVLVVDDCDADAELALMASHRARPDLALHHVSSGLEAIRLLSMKDVAPLPRRG